MRGARFRAERTRRVVILLPFRLPQTSISVAGCDSVKVFSSLVPALLAKNVRLEVWEQAPGSTTRWTRRLSASPGNVEAIMADISSGAMGAPGLGARSRERLSCLILWLRAVGILFRLHSQVASSCQMIFPCLSLACSTGGAVFHLHTIRAFATNEKRHV